MPETPFDSESLDHTVEDLQDRIEAFLRSNGYRLGTYQNDTQIEWHLSNGGIRISVKPEYTPVAGDHAVVVTPVSVQSWTVRYPDGQWKAIGTGKSYDSPDELLELLPQFTKQKQNKKSC